MSARTCEIADVTAAAVEGSKALARLLEYREPDQPPRCRKLESPGVGRERFWGEQHVAILADLAGVVRGRAGIVLTPDAAGELLMRLIGEDAKGELDEHARSALCEITNIAVSAAAGALGRLAGGVVVPSVPQISLDLAAALRADTGCGAEEQSIHVIDSELSEPGGSLCISFIWIPAR